MMYETFVDRLGRNEELVRDLIKTEMTRAKIQVEDQIHLDLISTCKGNVAKRRKSGVKKFLHRINRLKNWGWNLEALQGRELYKLKTQGAIYQSQDNLDKMFKIEKVERDRIRMERVLSKQDSAFDSVQKSWNIVQSARLDSAPSKDEAPKSDASFEVYLAQALNMDLSAEAMAALAELQGLAKEGLFETNWR